MGKAISIIIPIYNVERYLRRCLESVFQQHTQELEVILVNDGSTDSSIAICEEYKKRYPETIIINKENGGLSDARNAGTTISTGKYIYYLDSDDWISAHAISHLYEFAEQNDCQFVQSGVVYAEEEKEYYDKRWFGEDKQPICMSRDKAMESLINDGALKNFAWGKLYLASIVKKHSFPKGKYFEDMYWQHLIVDECEKVGILPSEKHYYWQRSGSISSSISLKNLDLMKGYEERLGFIQEKYPNLVQSLADNYLNQLCLLIYLRHKSKRKDLAAAYSNYFKNALNNYESIFYTSTNKYILHKCTCFGEEMVCMFYIIQKIKDKIRNLKQTMLFSYKRTLWYLYK